MKYSKINYLNHPSRIQPGSVKPTTLVGIKSQQIE